jgi:hypothetical protein
MLLSFVHKAIIKIHFLSFQSDTTNINRTEKNENLTYKNENLNNLCFLLAVDDSFIRIRT